jgi:hypothetical protein
MSTHVCYTYHVTGETERTFIRYEHRELKKNSIVKTTGDVTEWGEAKV